MLLKQAGSRYTNLVFIGQSLVNNNDWLENTYNLQSESTNYALTKPESAHKKQKQNKNIKQNKTETKNNNKQGFISTRYRQIVG